MTIKVNFEFDDDTSAAEFFKSIGTGKAPAKRTSKKAKEDDVPPVAPVIGAAAAPATPTTAVPPAAAVETTLEDVKAAFQKIAVAKSLDEAQNFLHATFQVVRIADIPQARYSEAVQKIGQFLAQ